VFLADSFTGLNNLGLVVFSCSAVRDVMGRLSVNDFVSKMEPLLRTVVGFLSFIY